MARRSRGEGTVTFKKKLKLWAAKVPTDQVDSKGKRRYVYAYGKTKEEAARKRTLLQRQVEERTLPEPHRMTVEDLMTTYIENKVGRIKTRTMDLYSFDAKRHINPKIGHVLISKLMPLHIERMQAEILRNGSPRAARSARDTLARALRQAVRWKLMVYNPAEAVEQIRVPKREMQVWEPEEVTVFLERAREDRLYALFFLALTTGMRMGELLALNWRDLSLNGSRPIITVRTSVTREGGKPVIGEPKTAAGTRRIALSSDQVDVLTAHQVTQDLERTRTGHWQDQGLVFPSTEGTLFNSSNFNTRHWLVLREVSGVKIIRFHDLRHTYASLAIRAGMDVRLLADRLGHRDPAFTLRTYAHVFDHHRHGGAFSLDTLLAEPDRTVKG